MRWLLIRLNSSLLIPHSSFASELAPSLSLPYYWAPNVSGVCVASGLREQLQVTLGSVYTIERELGGGGMSRVFVAEERSLGRHVVVKVLPPELAADVNAERFRREVQLCARLQHPHIVPLLNAGEADQLLYYTMPYIEGQSLRQRLATSGPLAVGESVRILREVLHALSYAHRRGVAHRDIKPENILLGEGGAVVADFGVAKALDASTSVSITTAGFVVGTPAYMAPEQAAGSKTLDHRADIYAVGIVAYEMLTGHPPFTGDSPEVILAAQLTETPAPISQRRNIPPALASVVMRCLAKYPADRWQTADELLARLDAITSDGAGGVSSAPPRRMWPWVSAAAATVAAIAVVAAVVGGKGDARTRPLAVRLYSVAVPSFDHIGPDPEKAYIAHGTTVDVVGELSRHPQIRVIGRTSADYFRKQGLSVRAMAESLDVDGVLEGSVRVQDTSVHVTVQFVRRDGSIDWSESYDRLVRTAGSIHADIARDVVDRLALTPVTHVASAFSPADSDAWALHSRGRERLDRRTVADLRQAIVLFEDALRANPRFARAHAGLADAYRLLAAPEHAAMPPQEALPQAERHAQQAIALDSTLADAHASLANAVFNFDWNWNGAKRSFDRAIALDAANVTAHQWYGLYLAAMGDTAGATRQARTVREIEPKAPAPLGAAARIYYLTGAPDTAITLYRAALSQDSTFYVARLGIALSYLAKRQPGEAERELRKAMTLSPAARTVVPSLLAYAAAVAGRHDEARDALARLRSSAELGLIPPEFIALVHIGLGEPDAAMAWLERARTHRSGIVAYLKVEPLVDPLRADPRFVRMLRELGLA
jgi:TolB-like protein/tRNA A-37 threonylcarbamoyl transferase component Bud32/Tfp pilus assembly protein PilF